MSATLSLPDAMRVTKTYTASLWTWATATPLISRNTAVASQPSRLLPSTRAWCLTIDWSMAAAFVHRSG